MEITKLICRLLGHHLQERAQDERVCLTPSVTVENAAVTSSAAQAQSYWITLIWEQTLPPRYDDVSSIKCRIPICSRGNEKGKWSEVKALLMNKNYIAICGYNRESVGSDCCPGEPRQHQPRQGCHRGVTLVPPRQGRSPELATGVSTTWLPTALTDVPVNKWASPWWRESRCFCRWHRRGPMNSTI